MWKKSLTLVLICTKLCQPYCMKEPRKVFSLVKRCQRSTQNMLELENVDSLEDCFNIAEKSKALALNYSPLKGLQSNLFQQQDDANFSLSSARRQKRKHFFQQPEEFFNCHALQCPESSAFTTLVNDSRFDYYSLYGNPPAPNSFVCQPELGIFHLNSTREKYETAYGFCKEKLKGSLAHVASEKRTNALSKLLQGSDFTNGTLKMAYVGLNMTLNQVLQTPENEELDCFLYKAWAPGHPKILENFSNSSCVAITTDINWVTVSCDQKLAYFCEIYTSPLNKSLFFDACDAI